MIRKSSTILLIPFRIEVQPFDYDNKKMVIPINQGVVFDKALVNKLPEKYLKEMGIFKEYPHHENYPFAIIYPEFLF